jgi:hypothetical protein
MLSWAECVGELDWGKGVASCVPRNFVAPNSLADVNVVEQRICADPCLRSWTVIWEYLYVQMLFRIGGRGHIRERISQHLRTGHMSDLIGYTVEESVIKLIPRHRQRDRARRRGCRRGPAGVDRQ